MATNGSLGRVPSLSRALKKLAKGRIMQKQFKDGLELNGVVSPEIQVALIVQALAEYVAAEWSAPAISHLMHGLQEAILDPVFLREHQAEVQRQQDQQEEMMNRIVPGIGLPGLFPFPQQGETREDPEQ
jgi:hypothetical protein